MRLLFAAAVFTLAAHTAPLRDVAFSPDSTLLATGGVDATVKLWRTSDRRLLRNMVHPAGVTSLAFSADGQTLVTGSYDALVRVWRIRDGALLQTLRGHEGTVWTVAVHGDTIASAGEDRSIRLWRGGKLLRVLRGHTLNVWGVAFTPDGRFLTSGSFDRTARICRTDNGALVRTLTGHTQAIVGIAISPDGQWLATGGDDSAVRIWRLRDGRLMHTLTKGIQHIYAVAFSADSQTVAAAGRERSAIGTLWEQIAPESLHGDNHPTVTLFRVRDGALLRQYAEHASDAVAVAFSRDGRWLASGGEDAKVKLMAR
ncbi:MAG TPA: WD40 repeat domain-containing protein [Thermoanaerobaculia bacterium]|jgi:WD40 repeat protein|nr:WD40 repeat domain-containing protein [Thermoanaerobaculia bacterium]